MTRRDDEEAMGDEGAVGVLRMMVRSSTRGGVEGATGDGAEDGSAGAGVLRMTTRLETGGVATKGSERRGVGGAMQRGQV